MEYELHPLCTLFPRLTGSEFDALRDDIRENGLRQPIVIHEGMILDGGNRYRACIEAGVAPEFIEYDGGNIVSFVLSSNLHRRHMTPGQQAAIVASAQDWNKAQSVGNPQLRNVAQLDTAADRAAQSGASHRTQQMADKVAKADPDLAKRVAHGEISLPKAVEQISPKKDSDIKSDAEVAHSQEKQQVHFSAPEGMILINESEYNELIRNLEETVRDNESMAKVFESDDQLKAATKEIKRLNDLCYGLEQNMIGYQSSENEAKKAAKMWKNKFDKLERQVKAAGLVDF